MLRYLRLYGSFLRFSFSKALEFRVDFFLRIFMDIIYYAVNIAFFEVLYLHTPDIAGWDRNQAMLFVGIFLTVDAIYMTVLTNNIWGLPSLVNTGGLDYYLTRPVSTLFFVSLRDFSVSSFINLIMAAGILGWGLSLNPQLLTIGHLLGLGFVILCGLAISYLFQMVLLIPIFWTHSARGFTDLYHILMRFSERPDRLFRGVFRFFITVIMPLALVASFPARLIMEPFDPLILAQLLGVIALHATLVAFMWKRGLRAYSSASS